MKQLPPIGKKQAKRALTFQNAVRAHQQGRGAQAEQFYRQVLATQPDHFDALHLFGLLHLQNGRTADALALVGAAVKVRPKSAAAWSTLGLVHQAAGRASDALACFDHVLGLSPDDAVALNHRGTALTALGRPADALASYDRALAVKPDYAEALAHRGGVLRALGRPAEALASCDAAVRLNPRSAEACNHRGNALLDLKRPADALACYDSALALNPGNAGAFNNRGNALLDLGRPAEALASYDEALALAPAHADAFNNRGNALKALIRPAEALASYDQALALRPDYTLALVNRAITLLELKRPAEALESCDRALVLSPDHAGAFDTRGIVLRDLKRLDEALASYDRAIALRPDHAETFNNRGIVLREQRRFTEALASYDRALALKPDYAMASNNRGNLLTELGRFEEANAALEAAIALEPRRTRFYYNLAESKRMARGDPRVQAMVDLARDMAALSTDDQIDLHFGLGKAFADIEDHARSFRHLLEGNALKRSQIAYDEAAAFGLFDRTRAVFTADRARRADDAGDPSAVPVFILGMPRSGSTLVEQILASHPQVFGAGEIDDFGGIIAACHDRPGDALTPEVLAGWSDARWSEIGSRYVDRLRAAAPDAVRITNKRLDNFQIAGLIHMALPNARIIHTRREPVDTCLSCFSKNFAESQPYTYDLGELGRYYRAYEGMMAHWHDVLPDDVMIDVRYEDVVADLEGQARRVLAHCGIDWDPRCLAFHQTERHVRTASLTQVRQPVYASSVGRWRVHEPFLQPLLAELGGLNA